MEKKSLTVKEKEAVLTAIGILGWSRLGQVRIRNIIKAKKTEKNRQLAG